MRIIQSLLIAGLLVAPALARVQEPSRPESPKPAAIVGCRETKLYHRPDCKWVKEIDKAGTRVEFSSAGAAKKAGMKPCKDCNP